MAVALVIVSHSVKLAEGVVELASQMARDVAFRAAGGTEDGDLGTSFDKVYGAVEELLADGHEVAILTDLGSATMTVESVLEMVDPDRVRFAPGPLVEGAVAAAVTAQVGGGLAAVVEAAKASDAFPG
ncbi:MAG: PTS-dependent dihydroxyacetone kinase phosphotransferase subunit DhaM [Micropruina sp.]|nr:MAG: PTS-dependent dihydroxyacetone kinase phosphotransferase subunit DhaM [Micropruina sp.]